MAQVQQAQQPQQVVPQSQNITDVYSNSKGVREYIINNPVLDNSKKEYKIKGNIPPLSITNDRNDIEYLRLTKYLYNDDGKNDDNTPNKSKSTPKLVFVLFYKSEIPDLDDIYSDPDFQKKINNAKNSEPIISRIFSPINPKQKRTQQMEELDKVLADKNILVLKIINPDYIVLAPKLKQNGDFPEHYKTPYFSLEDGLINIWKNDYHPFNWIKNKPRFKTNKEEDLKERETFYIQKAVSKNPDGSLKYKNDPLYPLLFVYQAGFPVMLYEGPYGNLSNDPTRNIIEMNKVQKSIISFIDEITTESGVPGVTNQDRWNKICNKLWDEYDFENVEKAILPPEFELNDIYKKLKNTTKETEEYENLKKRKNTLEKILNYSYNSLPKEVNKETYYDQLLEEETFTVLCEEESEEESNEFDYIYKPSLGRNKKEEKSKASEIKTQSKGLIETSKISKFIKPKPKDYIIEDLTILNATPNLRPLTKEEIEQIKAKAEAAAKAKAEAAAKEQGGVPPPQPKPPQQGQGGGPPPQPKPPQQGQGGGPPPQPKPPQQGGQGGGPPPQPKPPQQGGQEPRRFEQIPRGK